MRTFYLLIFLMLLGCGNKKIERLKIAASDLLLIQGISDFNSNNNYPVTDIVNIGTGLHKVLMNRRIPTDRRMRYDKKIDKFHIIGYSGLLK